MKKVNNRRLIGDGYSYSPLAQQQNLKRFPALTAIDLFFCDKSANLKHPIARFCRDMIFVEFTRFFGLVTMQTLMQTLMIFCRYCADFCRKKCSVTALENSENTVKEKKQTLQPEVLQIFRRGEGVCIPRPPSCRAPAGLSTLALDHLR